jgi:hypothetical protein
MDDPKFKAGDISTSFMEYFLAQNGTKIPKTQSEVGALAR